MPPYCNVLWTSPTIEPIWRSGEHPLAPNIARVRRAGACRPRRTSAAWRSEARTCSAVMYSRIGSSHNARLPSLTE
eukprot:scaffold142235_cov35-Tisochrysis_lutea.AAC.2